LFDLRTADAAPDLDLNEVIWKFVKGENAVMPPSKHSAFVVIDPKNKQDKD